MISVRKAEDQIRTVWGERDQLAFVNAERRIDEAITKMAGQVDQDLDVVLVNLSGVASLTKKVRIRVEEAYKQGGWNVLWSHTGEEEGGPVCELTPPRS